MGQKMAKMSVPIYTYISVAKPYGRFGQKLESLQGRRGQGTGQGNTVQDRSWQRDRAKVEQSVVKKQGRALCNINKQLCRAGPKRTASKKWVKI